jgi:imidazolonepropionase-like amidohydrolase
MDANVHLLLHLDPEVLLRYDPGCYDDLILEAAQVALRAGFTTVFDTWGPLEALLRVRDRVNRGDVAGSRIFCAGNIIGNAGPWSSDFFLGYGDHLNPAVVEAVNRQWEQGVGGDLPWMSADDVRQAVRKYITGSGIDFVKYSSSTHKLLKFIAFSPDSQRAIVEEAHAAGMTAQACTISGEALKLAIQAGVDLLQHGNITGPRPMPDETLDLIAERQLPCVTLLGTERFIKAIRDDELTWTLYASMNDNARRLIAAGAKLMMATDGGVYGPTAMDSAAHKMLAVPDYYGVLGTSHLLWYQAAAECGMRSMEILLSTTRNIAEAYRVDGELGTVKVGKRADLLVLDSNPLDSVESYARIAHVVKDGEVVEHGRLPERRILAGDG